MLRYRRYRVFVAFTVIAIFALWKFGDSSASWKEAVDTAKGQLRGEKDAAAPLTRDSRPQVAHETKKPKLEVPVAQTSQILQTPPPIAPVSRPVDKPAAHAPTKPAAKPTPADAGEKGIVSPTPIEKLGGDRASLIPPSSTIAPIHWQKQIEHFPVEPKSIIKLPSGKPKPIPKIQYAFKSESSAAKTDREGKLSVIKGVMQRAWDGYKQHAWMHDELKPVSGTNRDPFAGWGATMVDALDTLWIMGMRDEFEDAVKAVEKIDFTTTTRADIPLFETTIRYLGGFIAAYDLSDRKYKALLTKAVELAEILISAFDTPNRMPQTYYYWRP
jgi:mannosyl-oligosaccharide alpha-1,2-mannosidase